jgi:hypothetical protein
MIVALDKDPHAAACIAELTLESLETPDRRGRLK